MSTDTNMCPAYNAVRSVKKTFLSLASRYRVQFSNEQKKKKKIKKNFFYSKNSSN